MATFVLTVIGDDRSGLVDALARTVSGHGGNWERSQMARLAGKFAGIVEVTVPDDRQDEFRAALAPLATGDGLQVTVDHAAPTIALAGPRLRLTVVGTDRPGLLHAVTNALVSVGASIEELATSVRDAPMAGGGVFEAVATVALPDHAAADAARAQLEALADHLMVDVDLAD